MDIGRGTAVRQIPFASIAQIAFRPSEGPVKATTVDILVQPESGELLSIGSVSGEEMPAISPAVTVAKVITEAIGEDRLQPPWEAG